MEQGGKRIVCSLATPISPSTDSEARPLHVFESLKADIPDLEIIRLTENYRSSPQILQAAETVLDGALGSRLHPNCPDQDPVRLYQAGSRMGEAIFIAKEIGRMAGGIGMLEAQALSGKEYDRKVRSFDEIAVLCRTHRQAALLEKCFRQEGIPYVTAGRESFLEEEKVQGSFCFFRCLEHTDDMSAKKQSAKILWKLSWNPVTEQILDEHGDEIFQDADSVVIEIDIDKEIVKKTFHYAEKYGKKYTLLYRI